MFLQYPSFNLSVEFQGVTTMGYMFLVAIETPTAKSGTMMLIGPPPGGHLHSIPPAAAFAAAGHKVISDMKLLLAEGVDKVVDVRMRAERRVSRRELEEAEELAEDALEVARLLDARDLAEAEKDTAQKMESGGIRRKSSRPEMGGSGQVRSPGARQLEAHGFTDIYEVVLTGKGPGLWYEATEPPPGWKEPHDWTPRADPSERVLLLRQAQNIWHGFYKAAATASGSNPRDALTGGLGDAIGTDAEMKRYCDLVLAAPRRLSEEYGGLNAAQGQCYDERRQQA